MTRVSVLGGSPAIREAVSSAPWRDAAGITLTDIDPHIVLRIDHSLAPSPVHEIRLRSTVADDVHITDRVCRLPADSVPGVVLTANLAFTDHAVVRMTGDGEAVITTGFEPATWHNVEFLRLLHRALHPHQPGWRAEPVRIGLLGYGAIGHEHARAIAGTPGLQLSHVCDPNPARQRAATDFSGAVHLSADGADLLDDDSVDLVIISTPPDSHAHWALRALRSDRDVVIEKPMALNVRDCDAIIDEATARGRLAVVYQNRRGDQDFRAVRSAIESGSIGAPFHLEAFVGGFSHPCNYWHSDQAVSGGALFDWGSHVLDQIVLLMPGEIAAVSAVNHKRRWFDVTNADHARMTLHFDDGREATFIYSDLAAALKPRWYVLGTDGALVSDWRVERVVSRSPIGTLHEDVMAPADSPVVVHRIGADGSTATLASPPVRDGWFHAELAHHLQEGLPMSVTASQSRRVVALLEAAEESAAEGGTPVAVP